VLTSGLWGETRHGSECQAILVLTDAVEKVQNEQSEIFSRVRVVSGIP
jgi:hypothetical protein